MDALGDRIMALEEAASQERATSPAGAVLQLMLVRDAVAALDGPDDTYRQVDRLLISVIGFLETAAGFAAPPATAGYYLPAGRNPFEIVSEALAGVGGSA